MFSENPVRPYSSPDNGTWFVAMVVFYTLLDDLASLLDCSVVGLLGVARMSTHFSRGSFGASCSNCWWEVLASFVSSLCCFSRFSFAWFTMLLLGNMGK